MATKGEVYDYWNAMSCGEVYGGLSEQERVRYELESYIFDFAKFPEGQGLDVLEIGVGMGADHLQWAKHRPRRLVGIDLTERAVSFTTERLRKGGFVPEVSVGDAENLPFPVESFDLVYSWGVLHHTPDTARSIREVHRVLRTGGRARVMIYHSPSLVGLMLWTRYALAHGRPLTTLETVCANHLESPGTKAYSVAQARALFAEFRDVKIEVTPGTGDLLLGVAGDRHGGYSIRVLRRLWPRQIIKTLLPRLGLVMMIEAHK